MGKLIEINALGDQCPLPVVKAKKALDSMETGDVVQIQVDNEIAVRNLVKLAESQDCAYQTQNLSDRQFAVSIYRKEGQEAPVMKTKQDSPAPIPTENRHEIAVISSETMGTGNDELGRILMKGFLYALGQLENLPETVIFYNGGVKLTCEGSQSLADLKELEEQGVKIRSCGTCLDYYKLTDKLAVGEVTNMYDIVETMSKADKIIKP